MGGVVGIRAVCGLCFCTATLPSILLRQSPTIDRLTRPDLRVERELLWRILVADRCYCVTVCAITVCFPTRWNLLCSFFRWNPQCSLYFRTLSIQSGYNIVASS